MLAMIERQQNTKCINAGLVRGLAGKKFKVHKPMAPKGSAHNVLVPDIIVLKILPEEPEMPLQPKEALQNIGLNVRMTFRHVQYRYYN